VPVGSMQLSSRIRDYTATFEVSDAFVADLAASSDRILVVDEGAWRCHRAGCLAALDPAEVVVLPIAEETKTLESVEALYDRMLERAAKRNMTVVSFGGGITQDITGFMASTLYRGVDWVFVPTTLLAQADSCIGSKTSLNYRHYKNLIGTFYPPSRIHIYAPFLTTQDEPDYFSGLGEVVKLHIMGGEAVASRLEAARPRLLERQPDALLTAVQDSLLIKRSYFEGDEFDTGRRNLLNFGHCFGHAIETATSFAVPHGQAVVLGMILAGMVARSRGLLSDQSERYLLERLLEPAVPSRVSLAGMRDDAVIDGMRQDKKRVGSGLAVVMATDGLEMAKAVDVTEDEAREALARFAAEYPMGR
jgi:3-dehydroquinate synthase